MMQTYGTGYFKIRTSSNPPFLTGELLNYELDMSDIEADTVEITALNGTRWNKVKGLYVNPKITIHNPATDIQTMLNTNIGQVVNFTPYNDNPQLTFPCNLVSAVPLFQNNTAIIINIEITLQSVGYVEFIAM